MQSLRRASFLARLVLAWFVLSLGVAIASPVVRPVSVEMVCSAGAMKLLAHGNEGGQPSSLHTMDCPLCVSLDVPPVFDPGLPEAVARGSHPVVAQAPPVVVARVTAPLPARGPPAPSLLR